MTKQKDNTLVARPPIIAVMGHIDHGKSTLLDYIRSSNIVEGEAGGITQHLSAYEVHHKIKDGEDKTITFLDTPGHAAFSAMRGRGAEVADIVILIVSAEDGVQEQTKEALAQIKKAGTPYVVAITKIDKPNADVDRTKSSLIENEIYLEGMGGDISYVPISSKTGEGIDELLDVLLLVAEVEEFKADTSKPAEGIVVESHLDPKRGTQATLIITDGTLQKGMFVVAEDALSPVRAIGNFSGKQIDSATFSAPVQIIGFNKVPRVGSTFFTYTDKKEAEASTLSFSEKSIVEQTTFEENADMITIPLIIKSDVLGTLEAIEKEILNLSFEHAQIKILQKGVGNISENDIKTALSAESPIVIGFHVKTDRGVEQRVERSDVTIKLFDIIYKITEWLEEEIPKRIPKELAQEIIGKATILKIFSSTKNKYVIGGHVNEGKLVSGSNVKIFRRDNEVAVGKIIQLQKKKEKVSQVEEDTDFGMMVESKIELAAGDELISIG